MSTEVASLYAYIRGDTSGLSRALNTANQQLTGFGKGLAGALGMGALTGGFAALGLMAGQAVGNAVNSLKSLAQEALGITAQYEALSISAQQLMATQILQAGVTTNMADALKLATAPAQELLKWEQQLAIQSPFRLEDVSQVFNLALAMGFSASEAKRATQAFTDWSAAAGITGPNLRLVMLNMGQVAAMGKITGREIRDFAMHGLPAIRILAEEFGVSTAQMSAMVEDGAVPAGRAIEALTAYMERNYAGAAKNMATSWAGLTSSMSDVREQSLRLLTEGIFEGVQPYAVKLVDALTDPAVMTQMQAVGQTIGWQFSVGLQSVMPTVKAAWNAGLGDMTQGLFAAMFGGEALNASGLLVTLLGGGLKLVNEFAGAVMGLGIAFEGLGGPVKAFFEFLGAGIRQSVDMLKAEVVMLGETGKAVYALSQRDWQGMTVATGNALAAYQQIQGISVDLSGAWTRAGDAARRALDTMNQRQADNLAATVATNKAVDEQVNKYKLMAASQPVKPAGYFGRADEDAEGLASKWSGDKAQAAANAALATGKIMGAGAGDGLADGLKSKKAKAAVDEYANFVKSALTGAVQDSLALGKVDGAGALGMKPGENGPFEALFRIQSIAVHGMGGQNEQDWAKLYGIPDQDRAKEITKKFQTGLFDQDVKQYIDKDQLKAIWGMKQMAEDSQAALVEELGLAAKGKGAEVFQALTGTGGDAKATQANVKPAVDSMVTAFNAQLTASGGDFETMGGTAFVAFETGFVKKAEKSKTLYNVVKGMVENILEEEI